MPKKARSQKIKAIYRVENSEGIGPYCAGNGSMEFSFESSHNGSKNHPGPFDDEGLAKFWGKMEFSKKEKWKFGFESMEQLLDWFKIEDIAELQEAGFFITLIPKNKIQNIAYGKKQVIFETVERSVSVRDLKVGSRVKLKGFMDVMGMEIEMDGGQVWSITPPPDKGIQRYQVEIRSGPNLYTASVSPGEMITLV